MINYAGAIFLVLGFVVLIQVFGLVEKSIEVIKLSRKALADFSNPELDDDSKETAMQGYAKKIGWHFILLSVGAALALLMPAAVILLLDALGLLAFDAVLKVVLSWEFIVGGTVLMIAVLWISGRHHRGV